MSTSFSFSLVIISRIMDEDEGAYSKPCQGYNCFFFPDIFDEDSL